MTNKSLTSKQVLLRIITIISLVEFTIMNAFIFFDADLSPYLESIIDVACLATFTTPLIYAWVIQPYIEEQTHLKKSLALKNRSES